MNDRGSLPWPTNTPKPIWLAGAHRAAEASARLRPTTPMISGLIHNDEQAAPLGRPRYSSTGAASRPTRPRCRRTRSGQRAGRCGQHPHRRACRSPIRSRRRRRQLRGVIPSFNPGASHWVSSDERSPFGTRRRRLTDRLAPGAQPCPRSRPSRTTTCHGDGDCWQPT